MSFSYARRRFIGGLSASATLVLATGCATGGGAPVLHKGGDEAALLQRAQAYWAALQKNDKVTAWSFEQVSKDPSWTLEAYIKRGGVVFDALEVRGIKSIDGDEAVVNVWMRFSVPLLRIKGQEAVEQDRWKLIDGEWRHVLKQSVMFSS